MREITARALAGAVGGILVHEGDAPSVEHISLDSRKMTGNDLFVPIIGERADGHDYICMAIGNGATGSYLYPVQRGQRKRNRGKSSGVDLCA